MVQIASGVVQTKEFCKPAWSFQHISPKVLSLLLVEDVYLCILVCMRASPVPTAGLLLKLLFQNHLGLDLRKQLNQLSLLAVILKVKRCLFQVSHLKSFVWVHKRAKMKAELNRSQCNGVHSVSILIISVDRWSNHNFYSCPFKGKIHNAITLEFLHL